MSFLEELKRRRMVRAALVYGAVGWAVVQAADVFVPALRLPDALITGIALVVLLGFPLAMSLAWLFDLTPEGVRRTSSSDGTASTEIQARSRWIGVPTVVVVVVALLTGSALGWSARQMGADGAAVASGVEAERSIAVLPFVDLSQGGGDQYLGDGVAEELLNVLAQVPGLRVAARTSAFSFRDTVDLREVGRSLGVTTVMEGSVRRSGDSVRITAQLIDAETGYHLFSNDYDREMGSLVEVQEEIATAIARELRLPLRIGLATVAVGRRTGDPDAYDDYLRGLALMHERDVRRASSAFRQALDRDSTFASAWAYLAQAEALRPYYEEATWSVALPAAERAARRALALDSTSGAAYLALANVHRDRWEWAAAESAYRQALRLSPDDAEALDQYGQYLVQVRRFAEATDRLEQAERLDPLAWVHPAVLGWAHFLDRRYPEAEEAWRRSMALDRQPVLARNGLLFLLDATGREEEITDLAPLLGDLPPYDVWQGRGGGTVDVDRIRGEYRRVRGYATEVMALQAMAVAGSRQAFLDLLEEWVEERGGNVQFLWLPQLDPWRDDPHFQAVIEDLGLPG